MTSPPPEGEPAGTAADENVDRLEETEDKNLERKRVSGAGKEEW